MNNKTLTIILVLVLSTVIGYPFLALGARTAGGGDTLPSQTGNNGKYLTTNGSVLSWATASGTGDVVGPASSTDNAITRFDSTTGKLLQNSNWTIDDNGKMSSSISTEEGFSLITSLGSGAGNNLMYLEATNALWDRPMIRLIDSSTSGGAANIRIDSPNPDIEFVETDQSAPAGVFEIAINSDKLQINGRNSGNSSFEPIATFSRYASGAMVGIGTLYDTPNAMLEIVPTATPANYFSISSAVGASSGNIFNITNTGAVVINDRGNAVDLAVESDTDPYNIFSDGTNNRVGIGTNTPLQKLHVKGRAQFGVASNTSGTIDLANSGAAGLTRIAPGAPATDVTFTLPAFSGTAATLAGTETFTNKTLTSPTLTTPSAFTTGGVITLAENTSIALDPAGSADGKYSGTTVSGTAGATLAFGDIVYLDPTDSRWELADANSAVNVDGDARGMIGVVVLAAAGDGSATTILLQGIVRADTAFPALTINAPVYVSETAGDIVVTQPTTTDVVIRVLGFAITADEIYFNPSMDYITHI